MSGPLPLRLCCMAAMAPALTEAATQAKIKLPETGTAASSDSVSRHNILQPLQKEGPFIISRDKLTKIVKPYGTVAAKPVSHLNGDSHGAEDKQPSLFSTLQRPLSSIKVSGNIKNLIQVDKLTGSSFQNEYLKAIRLTDRPSFGKGPQIMNHQSPGLDNEEAKCRGQNAQNGSHTQPPSDIRRSVGGSARGPRQTQAGSGLPLSLTQQRSAQNMCRKQSEGGRAMPNTNSSSSPSPGANPATRLVTNTDSTQSHSVISSPDSNVDGERVDEAVHNARGEAAKKQAQLERRIEFLQRRLRRAQGRQVEVHTRQQLVGYEQYQLQNLQTVAKTISTPTSSNENSSDLKKELLSDDVKNLSTAALVSLVHRIQASTNSFQPQPQSLKPQVTNILTMADDVRKESKMTADKLALNLSFMQTALDSDATESSSGGESDEDSMEGLDLPLPSTPLVRRADWKWAYDRGAVASRWTWLQAQVSDLEYRIRQQSEIYRQARHSKGQVILGDPPPVQDFLRAASSQGIVGGGGGDQGTTSSSWTTGPSSSSVPPGTEVSPCNVSAVLSNVDKQASRLTQSLHCLSPANTSPASSLSSSSHPKSRVGSPASAAAAPAPNGLIDSPLSSGASVDVEGASPQGVLSAADSRGGVGAEIMTDLSPVLDVTCRAARCLPLKHQLRKRRLLRTSGLHLRSAKAAKLSSVKCQCHTPVTPCVLCGGRENSVQAVDPHTMPFHQRVAILDHSYHQVLSFQQEVPLSVHFEALLRSGEWQNKPQVRRPHGQRRQKYAPNLIDGRKKPFRKNAASVIIQSNKIRNKYEQKTVRKAGAPRGKRLNKRALNSELKRRRIGMKNMEFLGNSFDLNASSQFWREGAGSSQKEKEVRKRRGESAYDINNIVIPHSMASLTRVEKLEYKEIPIPRYIMVSLTRLEKLENKEIPIPRNVKASLTRLEKLEYKEIPIPSWRDITDEEEPTEEVPAVVKTEIPSHKSNGIIAKPTPEEAEEEDEDEVEDLSDESFVLRHRICEGEEKKRFSNFVQYPPTRRNRTHSMASLQPSDPSVPDPTRPATPSTPTNNLPVSMGTQASLDGGDFGEDLSDVAIPPPPPVVSSRLTPSSLSSVVSPVPAFSLPPEDDNNSCHAGGVGEHGFNVPRPAGGAATASGRERLSLGSSVDEGEERMSFAPPAPSVKPWTLRAFPLCEEDFKNLTLVDDETGGGEPKPPPRALSMVAGIGTLRPQPVEGSSQAGSSVSGSLPASPLPSSSSASVAGDYDAADPEWVAEAESSKKTSGQHKAIKR